VKRRSISLVLILVTTILIVNLSPSTTVAQEFKVFEHSELGFKVSYPSSWTPSYSTSISKPHVLFSIPDEKDYIVISSTDSDLQTSINNVLQEGKQVTPLTINGINAYRFIDESPSRKNTFVLTEGKSTAYVFWLVDITPFHDNSLMKAFQKIIASTELLGGEIQNYPESERPNQNFPDFNQYQNPIYGLSMSYPASWKQTVDSIGYQQGIYPIVTFQSGQEADLRVAYFNTGDVPIQTYSSGQFSLVQQMPQSNIIKSGPLIIGGQPGGTIIYTYPFDRTITLSIWDSWVKYGNTGYIHITFVANNEQSFKANLALAAASIDTIQLASSSVPGGNEGGAPSQPVSEPTQPDFRPGCGGIQNPCVNFDVSDANNLTTNSNLAVANTTSRYK
jgi:hypothetical protein